MEDIIIRSYQKTGRPSVRSIAVAAAFAGKSADGFIESADIPGKKLRSR